ncbi:menD [Symbiodinium natans]|uniref:MenD protein n=1 Tax=Symbiodinium natans TaxID=878477 RepID=A0A812J7Q0_9DINO|nr:menD [Symbiodinium natans]
MRSRSFDSNCHLRIRLFVDLHSKTLVMAMRQVLMVLWALAMCLYQVESTRSSITLHSPNSHADAENDKEDKPDSHASLLEEEKVGCFRHQDCPMCYLCSQGHCYKNTVSDFC